MGIGETLIFNEIDGNLRIATIYRKAANEYLVEWHYQDGSRPFIIDRESRTWFGSYSSARFWIPFKCKRAN